ncbi:MAG: HNH endonuclease [Halobacteriales archaeon]|nr:HNH endonuclease [Halobacteriales archaeon]
MRLHRPNVQRNPPEPSLEILSVAKELKALGRRTPAEYQRYRAPLQAKWRPPIVARDRGKCKACGSKDEPEVAHITDAVAFVRAAGHHRGVTFSYRWDNLVTLCSACHRASHSDRLLGLDEDEAARRAKVEALFVKLRRLRGWSTPFAVLPPALVPPDLRPLRSFHDTMRVSPLVPFPTFAKYASDGGLVFGDEEARPAQRVLAQVPDAFAPADEARPEQRIPKASAQPGGQPLAAALPAPAPLRAHATHPQP